MSESEDEEDEEEEEEEEEESEEEEEEEEEQQIRLEQDYQTMMANRNQKRKKKEERDKDEPLYCFCQQVSYGEMVGCDGEVRTFTFVLHVFTLFRIVLMNGFIWIALDSMNRLKVLGSVRTVLLN
jgi:hypothetical protein